MAELENTKTVTPGQAADIAEEKERFGTPKTQGVVSASQLEIARPARIVTAPQPTVASNIISSTNIPPEQAPAPLVDQTIATDSEALRKTISERQGILEELGLGEIKNSFEDLLKKGAFTKDAENRAGIDQKTTALNDINSQIREKDLKFTREIERLQDEPGLTKAQTDARIGEVNRKQARELADLSVISATRRDDLTTAQALVDRKVELEFEPIEQRLKFQQMMFTENKELFNAAETRQFNIKMRDEQIKIDEDKIKFSQLENRKAEFMFNASAAGKDNAYLQAIMSADTNDKLLSLPGIQNFTLSEIEKLDQQIKRTSLATQQQQLFNIRNDVSSGLLGDKDIKNIDSSPQGKALKVNSDLKVKMDNYQSLVNDFGTESFGKNKSKLDNAYKELQLSYKEAANLGVLNGPDLDLIESAIQSATPGFWRSAFNIGTLGAGSALQTRDIKSNLDEAQKTLKSNTVTNFNQLKARNPNYENSEYVNALVQPFNLSGETGGVSYDASGNIIIGNPAQQSNEQFFN